MSKCLSEAQLRTYLRDGVVFPIRVMTEAEAEGLRTRLERFEAECADYRTPTRRQKLHLVLTWMADLIRRPAILDAVEDVLGPDLLCWQTSLFIKDARDPAYVSWHQDGNYWGLSSDEVVTAWVALSSSTVASGCMQMMPGSHRWPQVTHTDTFDAGNLLTRGQVMDREIDEEAAVNVEVAPGEISLHHVNIAHASKPNMSDDRRIGIAVRYVTPRVRQVTDVPDTATLVRGSASGCAFELEPAPEADFAPEAVALHSRITESRLGFLYKDAEQRPGA